MPGISHNKCVLSGCWEFSENKTGTVMAHGELLLVPGNSQQNHRRARTEEKGNHSRLVQNPQRGERTRSPVNEICIYYRLCSRPYVISLKCLRCSICLQVEYLKILQNSILPKITFFLFVPFLQKESICCLSASLSPTFPAS